MVDRLQTDYDIGKCDNDLHCSIRPIVEIVPKRVIVQTGIVRAAAFYVRSNAFINATMGHIAYVPKGCAEK